MNLAIDTNAYVDFCRGVAEAVRPVQEAERLLLPFVVLAELRAGFLCGKFRQENERRLAFFLNSARVEVLFPNQDTTHHYARLYRQLRKQGTPLPLNDLWIASLVVQHDLSLLTSDRHFEHLPQILRV